MEGLLTEEVIAILLTVLMSVAVIGMVAITVFIIQIIEEDINGPKEKDHKQEILDQRRRISGVDRGKHFWDRNR